MRSASVTSSIISSKPTRGTPAGFAKQYPSLVSDISEGKVPWGKAPFPSAKLATYWVPTLGTKPIKIFPVHGVTYKPLVTSSSASGHREDHSCTEGDYTNGEGTCGHNPPDLGEGITPKMTW